MAQRSNAKSHGSSIPGSGVEASDGASVHDAVEDLVPICGYMGSKRKYAKQIAGFMLELSEREGEFEDLCCGTGSVAMALVNAGVEPERITMIDAGLWGRFWAKVSRGNLDILKLESLVTRIANTDPPDVARLIEDEIAKMPLCAETFLVLQAAAYGSNPVAVKAGLPVTSSHKYCARKYWAPPPDSSREAQHTLPYRRMVKRASEAQRRMIGVRAFCRNIAGHNFGAGSCVYIDPPYNGTGKYHHCLNRERLFDTQLASWLIVSESMPLPGADRVEQLENRRRGAHKGISKRAGLEFLSFFQGRTA